MIFIVVILLLITYQLKNLSRESIRSQISTVLQVLTYLTNQSLIISNAENQPLAIMKLFKQLMKAQIHVILLKRYQMDIIQLL